MSWMDVWEKFGLPGVVILALGTAVWYIYNRTNKLQDQYDEKVEKKNQEHIALIEQKNKEYAALFEERATVFLGERNDARNYVGALELANQRLSEQIERCYACKKEAQAKWDEINICNLKKFKEFYDTQRREFSQVWAEVNASNKEEIKAITELAAATRELGVKYELILERLAR